MDDTTQTIRERIIRHYCQSILWIDDEIHLDKGLSAEGANPLFYDKFQEFTKAGLLCHMMGFPDARPVADPYADQSKIDEAIDSCCQLARQSDVIIIDWMLGTTDSSDFAEKIIKVLLGPDNGFRFIVILSRKELSKKDYTNVDASFKQGSVDALWRNGTGQFLLGLQKNKFREENLLNRIRAALHEVCPDYLHVAALEIAGRIKKLAPRWLAALPEQTDSGILVERGNLWKPDDVNTESKCCEEIQECLTSNLLEDLTSLVLASPLASLDKEVLKPSNATTDTWQKLLESSDPKVKNLAEPIRKCVCDEPQARLTANQYKQLSRVRDISCVADFVSEIEAYTEFCEKKSECGAQNQKICPGRVYLNMFDNRNDIAVCISAACDCVRSKSLLFLRGEKMGVQKDSGVESPDYDRLKRDTRGKTTLRFQGESYIFWHEAETMVAKQSDELHAPIISAGVFRHDILNRLVSRYMSRMRRVGVNQPALSRELRGERPSDEE